MTEKGTVKWSTTRRVMASSPVEWPDVFRHHTAIIAEGFALSTRGPSLLRSVSGQKGLQPQRRPPVRLSLNRHYLRPAGLKVGGAFSFCARGSGLRRLR